MKLLLDTHTFLWSLFDPSKLGKKALEGICKIENDVFASVVTFWEISLKYGLGKLEMKGVTPGELLDYAQQMDIDILDLDPKEAATFHELPKLGHKDPFDRLIVWQAIQRDFVLISKDRALAQYEQFGLKRVW